MEQAGRKCAHIERILLVCGNQNAGKSRLLRHMLGDERLGESVPTGSRIPVRPLSRERCLAVRITSPHEMGETPAEFHKKIDDAAKSVWKRFWRLNYASAVQPHAFKNMPGIVETCEGLNREFWPERIRVVQLVPDQGDDDGSKLSPADIDGLRGLNVEVITIDARKRSSVAVEPGNVRILADFFDFS